jgi:hypothetical protein
LRTSVSTLGVYRKEVSKIDFMVLVSLEGFDVSLIARNFKSPETGAGSCRSTQLLVAAPATKDYRRNLKQGLKEWMAERERDSNPLPFGAPGTPHQATRGRPQRSGAAFAALTSRFHI